MKRTMLTLFAAAALMPAGAHAAGAADVELWRLDCGGVDVRKLDAFSDTFHYAGESRKLTNSCYVVRHGADYLLWDTGFATTFIGAESDPNAAMAPVLETDIPAQLKEIDLKPDDIDIVGISHNHFDHAGQAANFAGATLLIGKADLEGFKAEKPAFGVDPSLVEPWLAGGAKVEAVTGDHDVFGDGSVIALSMPGHTEGELALLVRLPNTGPVLLSGDVVHFDEQFANSGVPPFNADRADSLASMERMTAIAASLGATIVIQHDETHIGRLPAFPRSAD